MSLTRRQFGKLALAGIPAAYLIGETPLFGSAILQAKPNSKFGGVQIGVITYSYRSMDDQSAEATLKYVLGSGINAIELMDSPCEISAGAPRPPARQGGPGRPGGPGAQGAGAGRADAPASAAAAAPLAPGQPSWNGQPCPGGGRAGGGGGGARGQRAELTPEQRAAQEAQQAYQAQMKEWRAAVSMDKFKAIRKMYNDAGVTVYAYKSDALPKNANTSDAEFDYIFNVAKTMGATHTTMELPPDTPEGDAMLKRMSEFAEKHKLYVAYHTHGQGTMTVFDKALAMSKWNMSNVDLGHYVAAGNKGGTPVEFLEKHHERIASFHLKDRTLPEHCSLTVAYGTGDGMLKELLLTLKKNKWDIPATIELEYPIPQGSDAVQEVKKCVEYARSVLA
jgi:sugar phosphate isomerase/epimerase